MKQTLAGLFAVLACWLAPYPALAQASECKLVKVAEWPVRLEDGTPIIEGAINGQKVDVLLHTASYISFVMKATAKRLQLPVSGGADFLGDGTTIGTVKLDELRIGSTTAKGLTVRVTYDDPAPGVDVILGGDFMRRFDVEFDYPGGVVRVFQTQRCIGGHLAYWDPKARRVELARSGDTYRGTEIVVPVVVNGKRTEARLNSGSMISGISAEFARALGIEPPAAVHGAGCNSNRMRLKSFEIGGQVTENAHVYIAPEGRGRNPDEREVTLGNDFLRTHRVLLARSQASLYFSNTGAQTFAAVPSLQCDDRVPAKQ